MDGETPIKIAYSNRCYRSHQGFDFANYLIFVVVAAFVINLDIFDNSLLTIIINRLYILIKYIRWPVYTFLSICHSVCRSVCNVCR